MKILILGDIVGSPGREAIRRLVPALRQEKGLDLVVANAENAAGGSGVTPPLAEELFAAGVDVLTSGDHIWKQREIVPYLERETRLLRPANYPPGTPGAGAVEVKTASGLVVGVVNLMGRTFMQALDCPFRRALEEIDEIRLRTKIIVVDVHAEATSEKMALGRFLDGKVSAVVGTHTHVQTADEKILPQGTAYITDLGMTGPLDSILGRRVDQILERFLTSMPVRFEMAKDDVEIQGVIMEIEPASGRALAIERIRRKLDV